MIVAQRGEIIHLGRMVNRDGQNKTQDSQYAALFSF
jgi:hypothetical protein